MPTLAHFETSLGTFTVELFDSKAPKTVANFAGLAEGTIEWTHPGTGAKSRTPFYDGIIFHRVIKGFMIQVGCPKGTGTGGPGYVIDQEFNSKPHEPGTLSMARTPDPNSAGSQFFLCLERLPRLDREYTVFGKTADDESLAVVRTIGELPTDSSDRPRQEAKIVKATVIAKPK